MTWRVYQRGRLVVVGATELDLLRDCTIAKSQTYTAAFELNDRNGNLISRRLTIRGT